MANKRQRKKARKKWRLGDHLIQLGKDLADPGILGELTRATCKDVQEAVDAEFLASFGITEKEVSDNPPWFK